MTEVHGFSPIDYTQRSFFKIILLPYLTKHRFEEVSRKLPGDTSIITLLMMQKM